MAGRLRALTAVGLASVVVAICGASLVAAQSQGQSVWTWQLPAYIPAPRVPQDNPMSNAKFELGRHLFYDTRLSGNSTYACASCHLQKLAFTDGKRISPGSTGETTPRNAPTIVNSAWNATYTWANPALVTLEKQVEVPLYGERPIEMGVTDANKAAIISRLKSDAIYRDLFAKAFLDGKDPFTFGNITMALATFQRGVTSFSSRYDAVLQGTAQFTDSEKRGSELFFGERGECHHCHGSSNFNDQFVHIKSRDFTATFHNTGLYDIDHAGGYPYPNRGVMELSGEPADMGKFRAPSLRNIAVTAPYMHDGSVPTLEAVIDIYSAGGRHVTSGQFAGDGRLNPLKSDLITRINLSDIEKADLLAFLRTLTDEILLTSPRYSNPWTGKIGQQP